jgi:hypothetical protein
MVTARARVPAMACVGGPASGRGARRRRDLWRSSASRVAVTSNASSAGGGFWGPSFEGAKRRRRTRSQIWDDRLDPHTHRQTDRRTRKKKAPPAKTYRVARALFSRGRLISEASLPVFQRGWGRIQISSLLELTEIAPIAPGQTHPHEVIYGLSLHAELVTVHGAFVVPRRQSQASRARSAMQ